MEKQTGDDPMNDAYMDVRFRLLENALCGPIGISLRECVCVCVCVFWRDERGGRTYMIQGMTAVCVFMLCSSNTPPSYSILAM